jgi:hypothetical protein
MASASYVVPIMVALLFAGALVAGCSDDTSSSDAGTVATTAASVSRNTARATL